MVEEVEALVVQAVAHQVLVVLEVAVMVQELVLPVHLEQQIREVGQEVTALA
jgi:hypothetical protein